MAAAPPPARCCAERGDPPRPDRPDRPDRLVPPPFRFRVGRPSRLRPSWLRPGSASVARPGFLGSSLAPLSPFRPGRLVRVRPGRRAHSVPPPPGRSALVVGPSAARPARPLLCGARASDPSRPPSSRLGAGLCPGPPGRLPRLAQSRSPLTALLRPVLVAAVRPGPAWPRSVPGVRGPWTALWLFLGLWRVVCREAVPARGVGVGTGARGVWGGWFQWNWPGW